MDGAQVSFIFFVIGGVFLLFSYKFVKKGARFLYLTTQVQGPSLWKLLTVHAKELLSDNLLNESLKTCEYYKYQPFGFWMNRHFIVQVSDLSNVAQVFKSKYLVNKPTNLYKAFEEIIGRGSIVVNGHEWRRHRKVTNSIFQKTLIDLRIDDVNEEATRLVEKFSEMTCGKDFNFDNILQEAIVTITLRFMLSKDVPKDVIFKLQSAAAPLLALQHRKFTNPLSYWLFHKHMKSVKSVEALIHETESCAKKLFNNEILVIKQSNGQMGDSQSNKFVECMYVRNSKMGKEALDDDELFSECRNLFSANFETTSLTTRMAIVLLALHQDVQQRAFNEVSSIFGQTERYCTSDDLIHLEYLEMVIKETMRLYPPVPIIFRNADQEVNLSGTLVPKGSLVLINIMALHRNPENFKDPLRFNPDRFSPQIWQGRDPLSYIPFSYGQRNCVGQVQAMIMMKTMLCHLLRRFKILPGKGLNSMDDLKTKMHLTMCVEEFYVRLVSRLN